MPFKHPAFSNSSTTDFPTFERIFKSSIDINLPSFLASSIPCAATVPSPGILLSGGLIPSSSILNFVECDLYKSIG